MIESIQCYYLYYANHKTLFIKEIKKSLSVLLFSSNF